MSSGQFSEAIGKTSTLSGRTVLWAALLEMHINPIFGTGFESFWLGKRLDQLEGIFFFVPNEAHNGYLEIYLNLGLMGLFIIIGVLIAAYWKIRPELFRNFEWGRYRLGFFVAVPLYNCTEAGFRILNPILLVFYLIAITIPELILRGRNRLSSLGDLTRNSSLPKENLKASTLLARILRELYLKTINYMGYLGDYRGLDKGRRRFKQNLQINWIRFAILPLAANAGESLAQFFSRSFWLLLGRLKRQP